MLSFAFSPEQEDFRAQLRRFAVAELAPHYNRGLVESDDPTLDKRRRAFADELREVRRSVAEIAGIASHQTHP